MKQRIRLKQYVDGIHPRIVTLKQLINSRTYEELDFLHVCPYTKEQLCGKARDEDLCDWRVAFTAWTACRLQHIQRTAEYMDKSHSTIIRNIRFTLQELMNLKDKDNGYYLPKIFKAKDYAQKDECYHTADIYTNEAIALTRMETANKNIKRK